MQTVARTLAAAAAMLFALLAYAYLTLPDVRVNQTPVLEPSRLREREAERRRQFPGVARREQQSGVHVTGAVVLLEGRGRERPGVEQHLEPAARLRLRVSIGVWEDMSGGGPVGQHG